MARPVSFIRCPYHEEVTPSFALYSDGHGFCYGCHAYVKGLKFKHEITEIEEENVSESIRRILKLPRTSVRGLTLHSDAVSYYIVWPDGSFYKRRFLRADGSRYYSPRGVTQPLWRDCESVTGPLIISEGELNAQSIKYACPELNVCSPGGVSQIYTAQGNAWKKHLRTFTRYFPVYVLVDDDNPGRLAGIGLVGTLRGMGVEAYLRVMAMDANDILQLHGIDGLRKEIENLVLPEGMRSQSGNVPTSRGSSPASQDKDEGSLL